MQNAGLLDMAEVVSVTEALRRLHLPQHAASRCGNCVNTAVVEL